jgi:cephalosporin hydroxylase
VKLTIDTSAMTLNVESDGSSKEVPLYSPEGFAYISDLWVKAGWQLKYPYLFAWMGRPIIQLPEDIFVIQEIIYRQRPDVIVETGVAHGGSLVFYASLCELLGRGRVIGVDIEIRPHNREAIEAHEMFPRITLVEGSSTDPSIVGQVRNRIGPHETVLVLLDSNHSKAHVLAELDAYAPLVTTGSYIVATDGVMELVHDVPRGIPEWAEDNPKAAASEFLTAHPEFVLDDPPAPVFDESMGVPRATHWAGAYLRRR